MCACLARKAWSASSGATLGLPQVTTPTPTGLSSSAGNGVAILTLPFCRSFASFAAFAAGCGLVAGGRAGLLSLVCCQLFGQQLASRAYASLCLAFMLSQTFGSPTVALIYDESGSYDAGLFLVGALMLTASLLCVLLDLRRARAERAAV
mmetsp:Transcript_171602/g.550012  ORF Transcript_171602/g.550012 Transcript_171602/m.550012 type:complete len:150 (+) Transcript_171602:1782-2231(+)